MRPFGFAHLPDSIHFAAERCQLSSLGGGFPSQADWSMEHTPHDSFGVLRRNWMQHIISHNLHKKVYARISQGYDGPPLSDQDLNPLKAYLEEFLLAQGVSPCWDIPADQPMCLFILEALCKIMDDPDKSIFGYLQSGVPIGRDVSIQPSTCFPLKSPTEESNETPLTVRLCNWQSAESDPTTVQDLIDKEVAAGWLDVIHGGLAEAQSLYPKGIAIGKLGLALSDSRPARLVMDSSICGVNAQCCITEHATLPGAVDVLRCYPLRNSQEPLDCFSIDIKSAHKRIAVAAEDRGFLGFQFQGKLFFYRVCPFGAVFSAHCWSRLAGALLRLWHRLSWLSHASFLYVDDFFMFQCAQMLPVSACMICALNIFCQVPISWKKCEIGPSIRWIGWLFDIRTGIVYIPSDKREKLQQLIQKLLSSSQQSRKTVEKFLGLAMWVTQLYPHLRTWLHWVYRDLYSIPASHYSVDPGSWD